MFFIPSKKYKKKVLFIVMMVAIILSITIGILNINNLVDQVNALDRNKYKVLLNEDFSEKSLDNEGTLLENISILAPRSYEYISRSSRGNGMELLKTDYSKALNKNIAHKLVNLYKNEAKNSIGKIYYDGSIKRIIEKNIIKADNTLWSVDEACFLRADKTKIILRKDKEVFVLSGKDFDDNEIIKISKEKLGLE